eukprot:4169597-Prymnesium_polylepis.2
MTFDGTFALRFRPEDTRESRVIILAPKERDPVAIKCLSDKPGVAARSHDESRWRGAHAHAQHSAASNRFCAGAQAVWSDGHSGYSDSWLDGQAQAEHAGMRMPPRTLSRGSPVAGCHSAQVSTIGRATPHANTQATHIVRPEWRAAELHPLEHSAARRVLAHDRHTRLKLDVHKPRQAPDNPKGGLDEGALDVSL